MKFICRRCCCFLLLLLLFLLPVTEADDASQIKINGISFFWGGRQTGLGAMT